MTVIVDDLDASIVLGADLPDPLWTFNRAGVVGAADVHTALRLGVLGGDPDPEVALAVALAVRGPRVGHVSVDLATARQVLAADGDDETDVDALPWPEPEGWRDRIASSPLVAVGEAPAERPLRLVGTNLYLDRYWRDEVVVARDLRLRAGAAPSEVDRSMLSASLGRLFPGTPDADQVRAVEVGSSRAFTVVAGGPGTGKTTTVARLLAAVYDQCRHRGAQLPLVALAAPTGKAAARLEEAVRGEVVRLQVDEDTRQWLQAMSGTTLHRLLGSRPGTARFRHHGGHRLPHDIVVVDEASMISLAMMARLTDATRPDAHLVLVGDPEQLVSVEAGAVLADIVGAAQETAGGGPKTPDGGGETAGSGAGTAFGARPGMGASTAEDVEPAVAGSIVRLRTNHRFTGALADLAAAVRAGNPDAAMEVLRAGDPSVEWVSIEVVRPRLAAWAERMVDKARAGDAEGALDVLHSHRVLCAHRRGPTGVAAWNTEIELSLRGTRPDLASEGSWYAGRPVLVTANDYSLRLFNGDTGVTFTPASAAAPRSSVVFGPGRTVSPSRLADVDTVYAMTVHKSQGSEFPAVTLLLPEPGSRLLTRELLYTGVTRAKKTLAVVGTEEAVRAAVIRPIARASGLTRRLATRAE